jgi:hypothetical protein
VLFLIRARQKGLALPWLRVFLEYSSNKVAIFKAP